MRHSAFGWQLEMPGWHTFHSGGKVLAAVCFEGYTDATGRRCHAWCVYIDKDMPPGDSQHRTCAEAKEQALEVLRRRGEAV